ncbi:MAG: hypothetical protein ABSE87_15050 [Terracidiphilus sp.]|jgi:hypothetical protein
MKRTFFARIALLATGLSSTVVLAQPPASQPQTPEYTAPAAAPMGDPLSKQALLDWAPPALAQLNTEAAVKSSFTLDRSMLAAAATLVPESQPETRQAINKLDGVSIHLLRFGPAGIADETQVEAVREAYHLRGWKHLVTNVSTADAKGPLHNGTTDLWLVVDGVNVRGAAVLVETPKSLTLVTLAGNLSPADLLHLRGHFGIPRFEGDGFKETRDK